MTSGSSKSPRQATQAASITMETALEIEGNPAEDEDVRIALRRVDRRRHSRPA